MFEDVDDAGLIDLIAAHEKAISAATAEQARVIAALLARRDDAEVEFVIDEVRMELCLSGPRAREKVELAAALTERPAVWHALRDGRVDIARARLILDRLGTCPEPARTGIEADTLAYAAGRAPGAIRAFIDRRLLRADPHAAEARRRQAISERMVTYAPLPDGMGELRAVLPAERARALYDQLTALARTAGHIGHADGRGSDALRADALVALCLGDFRSLRIPTPAWLNRPGGPPGGRDPLEAGATTARRVEIQVLVPLATLLGATDEPAVLAGHGPIPHDLLHELAHSPQAVWRRLLTAPSGKILDVDAATYRPPAGISRFVRVTNGTCTAPGCRHPAAWADLDHRTPFPAGKTSRANLHVLCRHHHRMKHTGRWRVRYDSDGTTSWVTPAGKIYTSRPDHLPEPPAEPVLPPIDAHPHRALRLIRINGVRRVIRKRAEADE